MILRTFSRPWEFAHGGCAFIPLKNGIWVGGIELLGCNQARNLRNQTAHLYPRSVSRPCRPCRRGFGRTRTKRQIRMWCPCQPCRRGFGRACTKRRIISRLASSDRFVGNMHQVNRRRVGLHLATISLRARNKRQLRKRLAGSDRYTAALAVGLSRGAYFVYGAGKQPAKDEKWVRTKRQIRANLQFSELLTSGALYLKHKNEPTMQRKNATRPLLSEGYFFPHTFVK